MKKQFSKISIVISFVILLLKLILEISFFSESNEQSIEASRIISSTIIYNDVKFLISLLLIPFLVSLIFAILGVFHKNKRRFFALFLCILTLIIFITPIGFLILIT
ncbi:hypothetical protein [Aureivirga marina]|uniref:hypothetical protein n=1 Tax=Aureivirga marina TaxID=1182451 RepID=UPI0018C9FE73|nr:hypothetical protein [Aureivirga marina]